MRPVVSYDDITAPDLPTGPTNAPVQLGPQLPSTVPQPPTKKRKKSHNNSHPRPQHQHNHSQRRPRHVDHIQHWDEPGAEDGGYGEDASMYDDNNGGEEYEVTGGDYEQEEEEEEEEEESRDLTHEEIWDDSALIDAWNSATAEYEVQLILNFITFRIDLFNLFLGIPWQIKKLERRTSKEIPSVRFIHAYSFCMCSLHQTPTTGGTMLLLLHQNRKRRTLNRQLSRLRTVLLPKTLRESPKTLPLSTLIPSSQHTTHRSHQPKVLGRPLLHFIHLHSQVLTMLNTTFPAHRAPWSVKMRLSKEPYLLCTGVVTGQLCIM